MSNNFVHTSFITGICKFELISSLQRKDLAVLTSCNSDCADHISIIWAYIIIGIKESSIMPAYEARFLSVANHIMHSSVVN